MWLSPEKFDQNKRGDWQRQQPKWNVTLNKRWNWSNCIKLALSAIWTHGLIAQSVGASESNSVVVSLNPTKHSDQPSIATSKNPSVVNTTSVHIFRQGTEFLKAVSWLSSVSINLCILIVVRYMFHHKQCVSD